MAKPTVLVKMKSYLLANRSEILLLVYSGIVRVSPFSK